MVSLLVFKPTENKRKEALSPLTIAEMRKNVLGYSATPFT